MTLRQEISVARSRANVKRRLKAIYEASRAALQPVFDESADRLIALQKRYVPVDEGDLEASIRKGPLGAGKIGVKVAAGTYNVTPLTGEVEVTITQGELSVTATIDTETVLQVA